MKKIFLLLFIFFVSFTFTAFFPPPASAFVCGGAKPAAGCGGGTGCTSPYTCQEVDTNVCGCNDGGSTTCTAGEVKYEGCGGVHGCPEGQNRKCTCSATHFWICECVDEECDTTWYECTKRTWNSGTGCTGSDYTRDIYNRNEDESIGCTYEGCNLDPNTCPNGYHVYDISCTEIQPENPTNPPIPTITPTTPPVPTPTLPPPTATTAPGGPSPTPTTSPPAFCPWSAPFDYTGLPGSGSIQSQSDVIFSGKLLQAMWRGDHGYSRAVPLKADGSPDWNCALAPSSTPGGPSPTPTTSPLVSHPYLIPIGTKDTLTINIGSGVSLTPAQTCNDVAQSGMQGVDTREWAMGATSGTFTFTYDAYAIPDKFDIYYEDKQIYTTGGEVADSGSAIITYGPGSSTNIKVVVTANQSGTAWNYKITCPTTTTTSVYTRFGVKLFGVENTPEIKVWFKVRDLVKSITPPASPPADGCQDPGAGEIIYKDVPMVTTGGIYYPKPGGSFTDGTNTLTIDGSGYLPLAGVTGGRNYALFVKGPKHRSVRMEENIALTDGQNTFDWSAKLLEPGDLQNPNSSMKQDCTVNSVDISLLTARMGATDTDNLTVADVNYDNVVNSADMSKVVNTLSTKPDDDN